jgi:asparagine synthase (glutamine-hydrolysing)
MDCGRFVVAADASLYESATPGRVGRGEPPQASAELVASALTRSADLSGQLEGDFAFAIWDKQERTLVLSRDLWGQRPISYATPASGVVFATAPPAVVAHPDVSRAIDVDYLAAAAAHLVPAADRCAFQSVRVVPPGQTVGLSPSGALRFTHSATPPRFEPSSPFESTADAARALRGRLVNAVVRRLADDHPTAIWMSGGWDSPAIYAAGRVGLGAAGRASTDLLPISLSYPEGDIGREDELINSIAEFWDARITWVYTQDISLLDGADERAARREDPFAHPFEPVQRALARATRSCGCRVVLDGNGGDQLFSGGGVDTAELFQTGQWLELLRRYRRAGSTRQFARNCILPLLGRDTREWISLLRGRPLRGYWDVEVPPWIVPRESLSEAAQPHVDPEPGESATAYEVRYLVTHPQIARVVSWAYAIGLEEGVTLRSPMLDQTVVNLVAHRPATERYDGVTSKILLRESVRGLLPDQVLAPRLLKTGTPVDLVKREYRPRLGTMLRNRLGSGRVELVEMGVLSREGLERAISTYESGLDYQLGHRLLSTLQAEWWIAAQAGRR